MATDPAARVDLAEWARRLVTRREWNNPDISVPLDVMETLVAVARAAREVTRLHRECWLDTCPVEALRDALANVIDTAGPGGSG